ncbi:glutathione S-transferase family protein [Hydrogenophaga sp. PAMC20947]|uniref:glutathione S-transferase family protein n=1 Tax=Hydrogenophaga sp. PAMC20947 TaxID=2565558 RepID=UPI00109DF142|nr:glutathione S-transferase family protein [Hydrogenophaga sp. PAMC20947]QCB48368.1 glutathione S-transferase family protein [Hydrogenophaga sp. PAMC20947]
MPLILYHCVSARSFRPLWMLEELGLPYTLKMLPFPPRALARDYLQENPLGTVPLLVDGSTRMTESAAICEYLARRHSPGHLDVAVDEPGYGSYLNWLHMSDATLTFPQTLVLRYAHFEPTERKQPQVVEDYSRWFLARLRAADASLQQQQGQHDHLCAGRFTAVDVAVGYALLVASHLGLSTQFTPPVAAYWARLQQRPAFQRALAIQHQAALDQGVPTTPAPDVRP